MVLLQSVLCGFALRDILGCPTDELGPSFRSSTNHGESVLYPPPLPIRVFHPILSLTTRSLCRGAKRLVLIPETTEVVRVHESSEECQVLPMELFRVIA